MAGSKRRGSSRRGAPERDALQDTEVRALTARFAELRLELFRDAVDTVIEMGKLVSEIRPLVKGQFLAWLASVGVSAAAAHNYETLAGFAEDHPGLVQKWKELGPTKLYRVVDMTPEGRQAVLRLPDKQRLVRAPEPRFMEVTEEYVRLRRVVTPAMRAHGLRMKVQAWDATVREADLAGLAKADVRAGLRTDLLDLCKLLHALADRLK